MPNIWDSNGRPCYESEGEYQALQDIDWSPRYRKTRHRPPRSTAEEDFAEPHEERSTPEEDFAEPYEEDPE